MNPQVLALCKSITSLEGLDLRRHVMEPKLDGFRLQAIVDNGVHLYTRTNHVATGKMPAVESALSFLPDGTILDGEAVFLDPITGAADYNQTARIMGSGADKAVLKQRTAGQISFVVFDILMIAGAEVRDLPFHTRRMLLERAVAELDCSNIIAVPQAKPSAHQHREYTEAYGEGSVVKDLEAQYPNGRSRAMLKWKKCLDEDVVVMGSEPGKGKFEGLIGAIVFGQHGTPPNTHKCTALCDSSTNLHERGRCSGMTDVERIDFSRNLPAGKVMEITHNGFLSQGGLRHPQFHRMRTDKNAESCIWQT